MVVMRGWSGRREGGSSVSMRRDWNNSVEARKETGDVHLTVNVCWLNVKAFENSLAATEDFLAGAAARRDDHNGYRPRQLLDDVAVRSAQVQCFLDSINTIYLSLR